MHPGTSAHQWGRPVEAMARRRSVDKLLSEATQVLGEMVRESKAAPLGELETYSQRMSALAKAVGALAKVEHDRWSSWSAKRLRDMTDDELEEHLQREADKEMRVARH